MKIIIKIVFLGFVLFLGACVKDLDFNQAKQLELKPTVSVSLVKFKITQNTLVVNNIEKISLTDKSKFNYLDNDTARKNLRKVTIKLEINNPFDREFELDMLFYDETGKTVTYTIPTLKVPANKADFSHLQEIPISSNSMFLNSRFIQTTVRLLPSTTGEIIDVNEVKTLVFKSAGILYFSIN